MARLRNTSAGSQARESARAFVDRYIDFVEQLPWHDGVDISDLGVSRFTMSGRPITSYGNPQKDGPAHTAFAVLAALGESARSYAVSKPYLEYLSRHIFGPSFDPWEFAFGDVVFDYNLARRALRKGAELAQIHGDDVAASRYRARAGELQTALEAFKSAKAGSVLSVLIFTVAVYGIHRLWLRLPLDRQ